MEKNKSEIVIHVEGGLIQDILIPETLNIRIKVKDYDGDLDVSESNEYHNIKEDENGTYEEGILEN